MSVFIIVFFQLSNMLRPVWQYFTAYYSLKTEQENNLVLKREIEFLKFKLRESNSDSKYWEFETEYLKGEIENLNGENKDVIKHLANARREIHVLRKKLKEKEYNPLSLGLTFRPNSAGARTLQRYLESTNSEREKLIS